MQENRLVKLIICAGAIALLIIRLILPSVQIDSVTIGLLIVAILPWLPSLLESAKLPGGWELKFRALEQKLETQTEKIRTQIGNNQENLSASVSYQVANTTERIIYDSKNREAGYDFKGSEGQIWKTVGGKDVATTSKGLGMLLFEKDSINLQRTNTDGRYEVLLQTYFYDSGEKQSIPKDEKVQGPRHLRIGCEVRVQGGEHTLKFVFKGSETGKWLAQGERRITQDQWVPVNMYFLVSPSEECRLRIDDQEVSRVPSSLQIRNFVLAEKISSVNTGGT